MPNQYEQRAKIAIEKINEAIDELKGLSESWGREYVADSNMIFSYEKLFRWKERLDKTLAMCVSKRELGRFRIPDKNPYAGHLDYLNFVKTLLESQLTALLEDITKHPVHYFGHEEKILESSKRRIPAPPDFTKISPDGSFAGILLDRWNNVHICMNSGAFVAALVMMGSLLEGVLYSVISTKPKEANKSKSSPKDENRKTKPFHEWSLNNLTNVAIDCEWLQRDIGDFSHSLRNYRNIVHPYHHFKENFSVDRDTCEICWKVVKAAINDVS